jgi:hypothetical protein
MGSDVRVSTDHGSSFQLIPTIAFTGDMRTDPGPGPGPGPITEQYIVDQTVAEVLAEYGLTEEQARPEVLARGDGFDGKRIILFGLTFPSGATGVWLQTVDQDPDGWSNMLGRLPHAPAGTPLDERLVAADVDGFRLALRAPAGAVRAEVLDTDGTLLGSVHLDDGTYVGEVPGGSFPLRTDGGLSVRALDASGNTVAEASVQYLEAP